MRIKIYNNNNSRSIIQKVFSDVTQLDTLIAKRLDRAVADMGWRLEFPDVVVELLPHVYSDYNSILVRCAGIPQVRGPKPFRFEATWSYHENYEAVIERAWLRVVPQVFDKLLEVIKDSTIFNKEVFRNIFRRKRLLEARIKGIQRSLDDCYDVNLVHLEMQLQKDYSQVLRQEEMLWYQKFREKWVKLGDKNIAFLHAQTMVCQKRNKVEGVHIDGSIWCTNSDILKHDANKFFKDIFVDQRVDVSRKINVPHSNCLSLDNKLALSKPITKDDMWNALKFMKAFKALDLMASNLFSLKGIGIFWGMMFGFW